MDQNIGGPTPVRVFEIIEDSGRSSTWIAKAAIFSTIVLLLVVILLLVRAILF